VQTRQSPARGVGSDGSWLYTPIRPQRGSRKRFSKKGCPKSWAPQGVSSKGCPQGIQPGCPTTGANPAWFVKAGQPSSSPKKGSPRGVRKRSPLGRFPQRLSQRSNQKRVQVRGPQCRYYNGVPPRGSHMRGSLKGGYAMRIPKSGSQNAFPKGITPGGTPSGVLQGESPKEGPTSGVP
jgi:hypothetical protein